MIAEPGRDFEGAIAALEGAGAELSGKLLRPEDPDHVDLVLPHQAQGGGAGAGVRPS